MQKQAYLECGFYERCNLNKCPLAFEFNKLFDLPDDLKLDGLRKCKLGKERRMNISSSYNLSNKGLTSKEKAAMDRWANMGEEEKKRRLGTLEKARNSAFVKENGNGT